MKKLFKGHGMILGSGLAGLIVAMGLARCGDSTSGTDLTYIQIERLARAGINEALVISPKLMLAFNGVGPSLDLKTPAADVVAEVAQVLTALYGGACFLGLTPHGGCPTGTGASIFGADNKLNSATAAKAAEYVTLIAGQFLPDVLRIDTGVASTYLTLCAGGAAGKPLLCGGRKPDDDSILVTYTYLLNGKAFVDSGLTSGFVDDNVTYAGTGAQGQGHAAVDYATFPFLPVAY